jgi:hypothetical protein
MTSTTGRAPTRSFRGSALSVALAVGLTIGASASGAAQAAHARPAAAKSPAAKRVQATGLHKPKAPPALRTASTRRPTASIATSDGGELSLSDEYERAELVEQMLAECRGISYNAYELARTSGEQLWLPAPIQLMVVRVRHPYCAELLRTYAPKTGI